MGTISDKTTYLNTTKTKIREKINDLGQDLDEEDTFRSYAEALEQVWNEYPKVTATDVEEATLNGTKKGRMEIDLNGQTYQDTAILPSEFQQVEYIENIENSYIDTGKILTQNNSVEFKMRTPSNTSSNIGMNFGSRSGASINNISSNFQYSNIAADFNNSNYGTYRATYSNMQVNTEYIIYCSKYTRKIYDKNKNILAENNNICNDTITTPNTVQIFSINPRPAENWFNGTIRLYYFKIWENDELVMNLIPCYRKSDNEIGLYDLVTKTFLTNQGTGTFLKGNDVSVPNPDFPQQIKNVTGNANVKIQNKNLFSTEWEQGGVDGNTGENFDSTALIRTKGYIKVIPETRYSISRTIFSTFMNVRGYDKNKNYIGSGTSTINTIVGTSNGNPMHNNENFCVIEPKANVYYLRFNDNSNDISTKYMMVEGQYTAETMPSYVPHQEQNYPFSLKSKNLFNPALLSQQANYNTYNENTGLWTTSNAGSSNRSIFYDVVGNSTSRDITKLVKLEANKKYTIKMYNFVNNTEDSTRYINYGLFDNTGTFISGALGTEIYTFTTQNECWLDIRRVSPGTFSFSKIQIEQGSTATDYEPYYDIKAMQGTTLQDDGIHNKWGKVIFDGTENWRWNDTKGGAYCDSFRNIIYSQAKSYANAVCNYFILNKNQTWVNNHFGFNDTGTTIWFLNTSKFSSLTEWTSWLAQQYANDTPITVEYELATEETILYQGVQQAQYNAIKQAKSYDDQTNISSESDELGFKMDVEILSNGVSSSNTRTLALGSFNQGSLNNIKAVDTEEAQDTAQDEAQVVESEE